MTMTPDERAKALVAHITREPHVFGPHQTAASLESLIAAAIREAENAALESAAQVLATRAGALLPPDNKLVGMAAATVRSLKHKD